MLFFRFPLADVLAGILFAGTGTARAAGGDQPEPAGASGPSRPAGATPTHPAPGSR
jgi:hypothetical protein